LWNVVSGALELSIREETVRWRNRRGDQVLLLKASRKKIKKFTQEGDDDHKGEREQPHRE